MSWTEGPLLGFDTETTGVDVATDRIVTAALVRRDATGTHVRSWLLAPGVPIPAEVTAIHGVSTEQAERYGQAPAQALEEIAAEIAQAVRDGVPLVAYNAAFDLCLLEAELSRHGVPTLGDRLGTDVGPVLDPLVLDRCVNPDREGGRRLADLCTAYGVLDTGPLHTAHVDVLATLDLLTAVAVRHDRLAVMDAAALHRLQAEAHRAWAEGHDARRVERGEAGQPTDPVWPVRTRVTLAGVA